MRRILIGGMIKMRNDYKELYEERAAIIEFDGGFSRQEAEEKALAQVTNDWIEDQNLSMSDSKTYLAISKFKRDLKK